MNNYQFGGECEDCELAEKCHGFCMKDKNKHVKLKKTVSYELASS